MNRFEVVSTALFPGKVRDIYTDFTFYCYDSDKVVEHLNKMLEKLRKEEERKND